MSKTVHIASDHAGFALKRIVLDHLAKQDRVLRDHGADSTQSCDYPIYAQALCKAVLAGGELGILICGSGLGMSMMANRFRGIRAAVCTNEFLASVARRHNNANVLCLGERVVGAGLALAIVDAFLQNEFEGGRHLGRIAMLDC
ncbi:MAG: ribose 5-phosphate isomerase B, partial [Deltaproteobacteria bacterium]|nr:ribose 5-phosphate isomerase B [Deltaproteobacteria bacterium]